MTDIVQVNTRVERSATPNNLQQTLILVSAGGTNLSAGTVREITDVTDLTPLLVFGDIVPVTNNTLITQDRPTHSLGVLPSLVPSKYGNGPVNVTLSGFSPSGWNVGPVPVISTGGGNTYFSPAGVIPNDVISENPTVAGQALFNGGNADELLAWATTYFKTPAVPSCYVLELGVNTPQNQITALATYLLDPKVAAYVYLIPATWRGVAEAVALAANYAYPQFHTYFYLGVDVGADVSAWVGKKSVVMAANTPGQIATQSPIAAYAARIVTAQPNAAKKMTPITYSPAYGVTSLDPSAALMATLKANRVNWIDSGAEGGLTNTILGSGVTADNLTLNYWYAQDWGQLELDQKIAEAVIRGANNRISPLKYNQQGIDTLSGVIRSVINTGVTFKLFDGKYSVTAVPYKKYKVTNPADVAAGIYKGFRSDVAALRGFDQLIFNLTVTDIPQ
jgi:hypothetical protein